MRIAFVSTILQYPWGGADTLWTHAAEAAAARGDKLLFSISSAVASSPRISALRSRGSLIHERRTCAVPGSRTAQLFKKLAGLVCNDDDGVAPALSAFRPDFVIISLGGTYDLILHRPWIEWLVRTKTKYRIIANWQEENPVLPERDYVLARQILTSAEQVNFVSTRNMEVTRRHLLEPLPNARVLHNPLRWKPSDVTGWPASPVLRLAIVSRLEEAKGIQLLLHALATLVNPPDWHLNIYGVGPAEKYLRELVHHLNITGHVIFCGYAKHLRSIWAENHILISPSLEDGVPMTIPEAMLCQRPVIATEVGGAEDWITDCSTGFLCAAPTLPLMTATLTSAFTACNQWPSMGVQAATAALAHYRPEDYLKLLDSC